MESQLFDLFASLGATDEQLDFTVLYASAKQVGAKDTWWSKWTDCGGRLCAPAGKLRGHRTRGGLKGAQLHRVQGLSG